LPLFGGQTVGSSEIKGDEDARLALEGSGLLRVEEAIRQNVFVDHAVNITHGNPGDDSGFGGSEGIGLGGHKNLQHYSNPSEASETIEILPSNGRPINGVLRDF
jgi:hypothetical protein